MGLCLSTDENNMNVTCKPCINYIPLSQSNNAIRQPIPIRPISKQILKELEDNVNDKAATNKKRREK
jgi:hypothetical protein